MNLSISQKLQRGVTLIELMVVIAIIAILTVVAVPAYQSMVATSSGTAWSNGWSVVNAAGTTTYYQNLNDYSAAGYVSPSPSMSYITVSPTGIYSWYVAGAATQLPALTITIQAPGCYGPAGGREITVTTLGEIYIATITC